MKCVDLIHQQRFAKCKPMLVAIFENCPNHKQYMRRLMHGFADNRSRQHESLAAQEVA